MPRTKVYDLKDGPVDQLFTELLTKLIGDAEEIETDDKRYILEEVITALDVMDEDDTFGTEGWRHRYDISAV
ncbi:hypothetical protein LAV_00069 [Sphingobium phage Lacusarx]|uniref:Uncharacterized protein n=1 Tax=Sphingobium phage Lacusarx TaxID=1980139 RepID=A0A1W6DX57_9CAUD|nr:hypothetical protein FDH44_gp069 [Sphingobium phage Lacusarx]ARK07469.1 hypothetical protein LAV_00069 [Sphingobium phage Lacusarx]